MRLPALAVVLLVACGGDDGSAQPDGGLGSDGGPEPLDCTEVPFTEVNAANTSEDFRGRVEAALRILCGSESDGDLGIHTYRSITSGLVEIDVLQDLSDLDYRTVLVFYELDENEYTREEALAIVIPDLAGYMWGNRVYINDELTGAALAATLVHEVNHVLNRSDENYYLPIDQQVSETERVTILNALTTDPGAAFREEYRAFYLEKVYEGESLEYGKTQSTTALKEEVRDLYGFEGLDVSAFPDFPDGVLVPDDDGWNARPASLCSSELEYFPCE